MRISHMPYTVIRGEIGSLCLRFIVTVLDLMICISAPENPPLEARSVVTMHESPSADRQAHVRVLAREP